jgi:hypothetical protein
MLKDTVEPYCGSMMDPHLLFAVAKGWEIQTINCGTLLAPVQEMVVSRQSSIAESGASSLVFDV